MSAPRRVLLVHNHYRIRGGEDRLVAAEAELLRSAGYTTGLHALDSAEVMREPAIRRARRYLEVAYSFTEKARLRAELATGRWDLVHFHNIASFLSPAVVDAVPGSMPRVMTLHNFRAFCINGLFLRRSRPCELCPRTTSLAGVLWRCHEASLASSALMTVAQWTARYVVRLAAGIDRFLCPSAFLRNRHLTYGFPAEKLGLVPNFVAAPPRPDGAREPARSGGLYLGRLSDEKGVKVLLAALDLAPEAPFAIAGAGPLEPRVREFTRRHPRVVFHGLVSPDRARDLLAGSRYLVIPSLCYENQPLAALEAMAQGTPVVASSSGALQEIVRDGENGLVAPAGDAGALADRMRSMEGMAEPRYAGMTSAARSRYETAHTPAAHLSSLEAAYALAAEARAAR
jgi:glycosyltransferase involved in cell wall biosynthesis